MAPTIVWLHNDYRLADNPALYRAAESGPVIPLVIWAPEEEDDWAPGGAHRWWLHHSLSSLSSELEGHGLTLLIRAGSSLETLLDIIRSSGATRVFWNERYEPALRERDLEVEAALHDEGVEVKTFLASLLHDPDLIRTNAGDPYRVFTPFWKKFKANVEVPEPLAAPDLHATDDQPSGLTVDDLGLLPTFDWAGGLRSQWTPGEKGASQRLERFIDESAISYHENRNRPDVEGTSMLSPFLRYGEVSPRQVWHAVVDRHPDNRGAGSFLRELGWREFSYHLLYHYPHTTTKPLNERFASFPWSDGDERLRLWQRGRTGYPIVDAGMRQLWHIGWMHNRVRMIAASFLTKDLLIPWQEGARWFWDTLVDGDLANNTQGWQWTAGCGADAQPFFRIFNPVTQGKRFDPEGDYVREWIPELRRLGTEYIHNPWEAPPGVLEEVGIRLGEDYPEPLIDHSQARKDAMKAYESLPDK